MADDVEKVSETDDVDETKSIDRFYSLYSYHQNREYRSDTDSVASDVSESINSNFSLSVLSTNLHASAETDLRRLLSHRLHKGSIYSHEGCMASVSVSEKTEEIDFTCYYCLLETDVEESKVNDQDSGDQTDQRKYIICFLAHPGDNLEHFKPELDVYSRGILMHLDKEAFTALAMPKEHGDSANPQLTNINTTVQSYLQNWYTETLDYLCRCQAILQENVKYLLYCALLEAELQINGCDEKVKNDIQRYMEACNLTAVLHPSKVKSSAGSIDMLVDLGETKSTKPVITVDIEQDKVKFTPDNCTKFCEEWGKLLEKANPRSCGQLRQILENGKIKYIQSINVLKRLLMQAESDYYALYRSYVFLQNSGNCDILLHYIKQESLPEIQNVFKSLQEFIKETDLAATP